MNLTIRFLKTRCLYRPSFKRSIKNAITAGIIVAVLLTLYKPFGIHQLQTNYRFLKIAGFGLPCVIPILLADYFRHFLLVRKKLNKQWCIGYEILIWIPMLLLIGIFNLAYLYYILGFIFPVSFSWEMELYTFLIGMIPCTVLLLKEQGFSVNLQQMLEVQSISKTTDTKEKKILYSLRTERETLDIEPKNLCLIKAEANYVEVTHCKSEAHPRQDLIRMSLKEAEKQLIEQGLNFPKCHRSYLVNTMHIARVEGNSQGLTLHLDRGLLKVPVSRSCVNKFRQKKQH